MLRGPRARSLAGIALLVLLCVAPSSMPGPVSAAACTGWDSSTTPPDFIRVLRTAGPAAGSVQRVSFRTYVETVMPSEWTSVTPTQALRAGAVAIKQYAWYWTMNWRGKTAGGQCYDVVDSTNDQVYAPESRQPSQSHLNAVEATWTASLRRDGRFFSTGYRAGSKVACGADADTYRLYQNSAMSCARDGRTWTDILATYYGPGLTIIDGDALVTAPTPTPAAPTPSATPDPLAAALPPVGTVFARPPAGDSTGDGIGDVIVVAKPADPAIVLTRVYAGAQLKAGAPPIDVTAAHPQADTLFRAAADVTGDHLEDLIVLLRRPDGGLRIDVAAATPFGPLGAPITWWEGAAPEVGWADGVPLRFLAGDLDGDGLGDAALLLPTGDPAAGTATLWRLPGLGTAFGPPLPWWTGTANVAAIIPIAADLDADTRTDVVFQTDLVAEGTGTGLRYDVVLSGAVMTEGAGTALASWLVLDLTPAQARTAVSDINGDMRDDLIVDRPVGTFGSEFVGLFSTGTSFTTRSLWKNTTSFRWNVSRVAGADVNGDGRGDLVIMYNVGTAGTRFFRFLSTGTSLKSSGSTTDPTLLWAGTAAY